MCSYGVHSVCDEAAQGLADRIWSAEVAWTRAELEMEKPWLWS
jgi:hypothetical protein